MLGNSLSSARMTDLNKKRVIGAALLLVLLGLFLAFNRVPKLDTVREDLDAVNAPTVQCFQGLCLEEESDHSLLERWWDFSITYLRLVSVGMIFAFLVAGLTEAFIFPNGGYGFSGSGIRGSLKGLAVGPVMNLCSACIVPVAEAFRRRGAGIEATIAITQGSSTMNLPALIMAALVFTPTIAGTRIGLSIFGALMIGPVVALLVRGRRGQEESATPTVQPIQVGMMTWGEALTEGTQDWLRAAFKYLIRLGPIMIVAGFASGLAIQWVSPDVASNWLGDDVQGVILAATLGLLINVPLLFEIPLVAALMLLGMGVAPAATLLFAAAAGGPITFWGLARVMPRRAILAFGGSIWVLAVAGGLGVWFIGTLIDQSREGIRIDNRAAAINTYEFPDTIQPVTPFTNVARTNLDDGFMVWNYRPGVAVFDYDRDNDMDFYVTSEAGHGNFLYQNDGIGNFTNVADSAGVEAVLSNSSGVVSCDLNNDGYQDLYVGGRGVQGDGLAFRSALGSDNESVALREAIKDRVFLNNRDGTFDDVTDIAFGDSANLRSASTVSCADVDNDGWLDLYVGNLIDEDFFFTSSDLAHPGSYNVLYLNQGDMTFHEVAEAAGVAGPEIVMRHPDDSPVLFPDPETGVEFEGYNPTATDKLGNRVGDPSGPTHATMLLDYDLDSDPDLFVASDGDRLHIYRNDSTPGQVRFTSVAEELGIDKVGNWMGFATGDYDGDADLDIFVTNAGYHLRLNPPQEKPGSDCKYSDRFEWGTCLHSLLRNDRQGRIGETVEDTPVRPNRFMPPDSLDPENIDPAWEQPAGLGAYDFGYGATFFDFDNDGIQDLYWLGSELASGDGPGGNVYPAAGRMLRGVGDGAFEDVTVEAHLLDIMGVRYDDFDPDDPNVNTAALKIDARHHENGKGLAHGDLNGDGYVDLIGTNSSGLVFTGSGAEADPVTGPLFVWMNGGGQNSWLNIRLQGRMAIDGTGSNADAIGARVYIKTRSDQGQAIQVQEVRAGSSYLSTDSLDLEFGLGTATAVEEIEIHWPSGVRQIVKDVPANQTLFVTESAE